MKILLTLGLLFAQSVFAANVLRDGQTGVPVDLDSFASQVQSGTILIVSEIHDNKNHHANQVSFLESLAKALPKISVGFEFLEKQYQPVVDEYHSGQLPEADFLKAVKWGGFPFEMYRQQAEFPRTHDGRLVALNAARTLTSKVAKSGLDSLTDEERALLPSGFTLGNEKYFERFKATMGGHVPEDAIGRYFAAQSIWDDVMATTAVEFIESDPTQVLVILVGDFHAAWGGGLPDRIRARGGRISVISQVDATGMTPEEVDKETLPSAEYGPRSDLVWVTAE